MQKKLFFILLVLIVFLGIGITYLNSVILPTKIKSLIINSLQEQTKKKVSLDSLQFYIFKGLVLRNLVIYDHEEAIVILKESSCRFLIPPIFKKMIIIPALRFKSPVIFLKRKKDSTFNIQDLFSPLATQAQKPKFGISVYKINVTGAIVHFQDDTLAKPFTRNIENFDLSMHLSLPLGVKFNFSATSRGGSANNLGGKSEILNPPPININAKGEFSIPERKLTTKISLQNLSPREFSAYYQNLGIDIAQGLIDCLIDLKLKDGTIFVGLEAQNKNLTIAKEKLKAQLNSEIIANLQYGLRDKQIHYSGKAMLADSRILGLEFVDAINDIRGEVSFDNSGLSSDKLSARVLGEPIQAKVKLSDFSNPEISIDITSRLSLVSLANILRDKFKFTFAGELKGEGILSLALQTKISSAGTWQAKGYLDILNGILKLEKINPPIEDIHGRLEFGQDQIKWLGLNFKYLDIAFTTAGTLANFQAPSIQLELTSKPLSLQSNFTINNKLINLSRLTGKYFNSEFSITGNINAQDPANLEVDTGGELNIVLEDIKEPLKKFKKQLEQIKPQGLMRVQFNVNGNINNIKNCSAQAELSSSSLSAYGLKTEKFSLNYTQSDGIIDIPLMHLSLYDGAIEASAKMNLNSDNLPYWASADIQGVKIEKLKLDTAAKDKDIAGTIQAQLKLNGFSGNISKLSGAGKIFVTEGKLWQLNLFKGLGALLFARDFANIIFHEGYCGFSVQDKYIFTDNLRLKSSIADLDGSVKIGFDSSIDASLNVKVLDEMVPLTDTFKDITTAIIGQAGRFGVIKISGTLKEPKYKFQPAVMDIIKGLRESIFGK